MRLDYIPSDKTGWLENKNNIAELLAPIILHKDRVKYKGSVQAIPTSTNAICRTDEYIVKIFAPEICGYAPIHDFRREVYALELIGTTKILVPRLIKHGLLEYYKYHFYYCIIERIHIPPVSQFLLSSSRNDIIKLGTKLRKTLEIFQSLNIDKPELSKTIKVCNENVFVHSDLTGDNVLYDGKNLAVIDFEDWQFAPAYTELPAIIFEMIHEHIDIASLFLDIPYTELKDKLFAGINTHRTPNMFIKKYTDLFS
jgi:hypothetical protein